MVEYHIAVRQEASLFDTAVVPPPCEDIISSCAPFYVEVWVKSLVHDVGIACAYVSLDSRICEPDGIGPEPIPPIVYGGSFPELQSGDFSRCGAVKKLGGCIALAGEDPLVGVSEWVLLAREALRWSPVGVEVDFKLKEPQFPFGTALYGLGFADPVDYGVACAATVTCDDHNVCTVDSCDPATGCVHEPLDCDDGNVCTDDSCDPATGCVHADNTAPCDDGNACTSGDTCSGGVCVGGAGRPCGIYDPEPILGGGDGFVGPGDFALFAECWLKCPEDVGYDAIPGSCDTVNFVDCSSKTPSDDCVGPEDFSYFVTAWMKFIDDASIELPPACASTVASASEWLPLPTEATLRTFGLTVPPKDWKGYQRGKLFELVQQAERPRAVKEAPTTRQRSPR